MRSFAASSLGGRSFARAAWFSCMLLLSTSYIFYQALANSNGHSIAGRTQKAGHTSGCSCHCSTASSATTVTLSTAATAIYANGSYTFTVSVSNSSQAGAGVEVAVQRGTLAAGTGLQLITGELTQSSPKTSLPASWTFTYTAPATTGADTLFATGNAVNLDGSEGGDCTDVWNFSPKYIVNVQSASSTKAIALGRTAIPMGSVRVGRPKKDTMLIRSTGTGAISVSSSLNTGTAFSRYPTSTGRSIAASTAEVDTLTCTPTARGAFSDSLIVTSDVDATTDQRKAVYLSGSGIQAVFSGGASLDHGNTRVGQTKVKGFVYSNTGDDTLFMQTPSISGSGFAISSQPTRPNLPPGATDSIVVQLNPSSKVAYSGTLSLTATGLTISSVSLSGMGIAPVIAVSSQMNLGGMRLGMPMQGSIMVANTTGTDTLHVSGVVLSGPSAAKFAVSGPTHFVAPPGGQTTLMLTYTPTVEKIDTATLTISSDDNQTPSSTITITAQGLVPHMMVLQTDTLDFGGIRINSGEVTRDIQIQNSGTDVLNLGTSIVSPAPFSLKAQSAIVAAGATSAITIAFTPTTVGVFKGSVTITGDDPRKPTATVYVKGTGINSALSLPSTVDFANVPTATERDTNITISNTGSASVNIVKYALTNGSGVFTIRDSSAHAIAGNASILLKLRFKPAAAQSYNGAITLTTDDANAKTLTIGLSGKGVQGNLGVTPSSVDFGPLDSLTSKTDTVAITNTGSSAVTIDVLSLTGTGKSAYTLGAQTLPTILAPNTKLNLLVTFTPPHSGQYDAALSIHTTNDATSTIAITGKGKLGASSVRMNAISEGWKLGVSPNPARDISSLLLQAPRSTNVSIRIYDATGRMIDEVFSGFLNTGEHQIQLHTSRIAQGSYHVRVLSDGQLVGESKIIVQR